MTCPLSKSSPARRLSSRYPRVAGGRKPQSRAPTGGRPGGRCVRGDATSLTWSPLCPRAQHKASGFWGATKGRPSSVPGASGAPMSTDKCPKASPRHSRPPGASQGLAPAGPQEPSVPHSTPRPPHLSFPGSARLTLGCRHSFFLFLGGRRAVLGYDLSRPSVQGEAAPLASLTGCQS